jgi:type I restriction enzyme S subunit
LARAIFKSWFVDFDPVRARMEGRQPVGMDAETAALFPSEFEDSALRAVVQKAIERGTGARALRSIIEEIMLDVMYSLPDKSNVVACSVTRDVVTRKKEPVFRYEERKQTA